MSIISRLFPFLAIFFAIVGFFLPQIFIPLSNLIVPLLAIIMFAMGLTLTFADFQRVLKQPTKLVFGTFLQFLLMPLAAYLIGIFLELERELFIGLILVGCCPGGTSSNVICYLAKGNLALSVSLTMISTLLSVLATPLLTLLYLGQAIEVPILNMMLSILQMVIVPVFVGVLLNTYFGSRVSKITSVLPAVSMSAIILIIAIVVALNSSNLIAIGGLVIVAVILHNFFGLSSAYGLSKLCGYDESTCRTIAIEVGMQNSALGAALASQFYTSVATLPGAVFSLWHNLSGSALAAHWSKK